MKRLSFMDAMLTYGGYMVLGCSLVMAVFAYFMIKEYLAQAELIATGFFVIGFPIMLEVYRETVNERIDKGEFDENDGNNKDNE